MAMDQTQADAEAKRRFGSTAYAFMASNGLLDIRTPTIQAGITTLLGWGNTWEESLELAEARRNINAIDDPAKNADAEENASFQQLSLF